MLSIAKTGYVQTRLISVPQDKIGHVDGSIFVILDKLAVTCEC